MSLRTATARSRWVAVVGILAVAGIGSAIGACGSDEDPSGAVDVTGEGGAGGDGSNQTSDGNGGSSDAGRDAQCDDASPDREVNCTNKCGPVTDPCTGKTKQCGGCPNAQNGDGTPGGPQTCDLTTNTCGTPKITCAELGAECGTLKNSCGLYIDCPDSLPKGCSGNRECDPDTHKCRECQTVTCADLGYECGTAWLGCGPDLPELHTNCGTCPAASDGGVRVCNQTFHQCEPTCVPKATAVLCNEAKARKGVECGVISNGCGGTVDCDSVPTFGCAPGSGTSCGVGGAGLANRCGKDPKPDECKVLGRNCGEITSACTGLKIKCGDCATGEVCNANGVCGVPCTPKTCADDFKQFECGVFDDGCGSSAVCGCASGACDEASHTCCKALACNTTYQGQCGVDLPNGCGLNILDCNCAGNGPCTEDGGNAPVQRVNASGLCCTPRTAATYTGAGQCGTNLTNGCGLNNINAPCPGNEVCVNNATGDPGAAPPNGVVGSCCTRTDSCAAQAPPACAPVQNSCRPPGTLVDCNANCGGGQVCNNDICCNGAPACVGAGGEGAVCNTVNTPVDLGCGVDRTCNCAGGRTCWCTTNGPDHVCVPGTALDVGACKTALNCGSAAYTGKCGTDLDNGVGGTLDCGCGNGRHCTETAPNVIGACVCNTPTGVAYTCSTVPGGPDAGGGDACGSFNNGCGGTLNCGCPGGQVCNTAANPNSCCTPTACPANPGVGTQCGALPNNCGGTNSCGCPTGPNNVNYLCGASGVCICTPDTCRGRHGPQDDLCGGQLQCPF